MNRKRFMVCIMLAMLALGMGSADAKLTVLNPKSKLRTATKKVVRTVKPAAVTAQSGKTANGTYRDDFALEVVRQTNADRAKNGLPALTISAELTRAANVRAVEISTKFSHTRPDGTKWSTSSSAARGENIARGQQTPSKVMAAWMTSAGHRANILRTTITTIGVSVYQVGHVVHWVQLFG